MRSKLGPLRRYLILRGTTRILIVSLGVLAAFLVLSGYLSLINLNRVSKTTELVAHTQAVMKSTNATFATVLNAETQARGYLLTGDRSFIERMETESKGLGAGLKELKGLVGDNQRQVERVKSMSALIGAHMAELRELVADDASGPGKTEELQKSRDGLEKIRDSAAEINAIEQQLLNDRLARASESQRAASAMTVIQTIMGLALLLIGALMFQRELNARHKVETQVRGLLAKLSEQNRRKDEFLATLSHELRNPLAPLTTSVTLMKRISPADPQWGDLFDIHERQLGQLVHLVDDLLDLSRIVNNKIDIVQEPIDLRTVIDDAVAVLRTECEQKGIKATFSKAEEPLFLMGDQVRLLQVFGNLLNNACKFTPEGGRIQVGVTKEGRWAVVQVTDSGRGIASEDLETIFSMFSQVDGDPGEMKKGLGIGLTLAKRLVQLHGGELSVSSPGVGKGSTFMVRLPLSQTTEALASKNTPMDNTVSNLNVLVADDNEDAAKTIAMLVSTLGAKVSVVHDGEQAVTQAFEQRPDLILMDIGMPGMDGYEACRSIRGQSWGKSIFIAALTGWGQDSDKQKTTEAGFSKHLVKPVSMSDLEQLVHECERGLSGG